MRIEYRYNHLHAEEYLYYRKENLIREIECQTAHCGRC